MDALVDIVFDLLFIGTGRRLLGPFGWKAPARHRDVFHGHGV
jgi:hypothetical protein